jgi:hypothetical protein
VKEDTSRKDQDIALLKDAVHTERVKIGKLEKLIAQYSNGQGRRDI